MRLRQSIWYALLPGIVLMLIQDAASMFGMQLVMIREFAHLDGELDMEVMIESMSKAMQTQAFLMAVSCGYAAVAIMVLYIWYKSVMAEDVGRLYHKNTFSGYTGKLYVGIIILAIAYQYLSANIFQISAKAFPDWVDVYDELTKGIAVSSGGIPLVLTILYVTFLGPIAEEVCFRGLTYSLARRNVPHWSANILQALVFAGIHNNPLQAIYAFVFALILGDVVGKTGNLYITILIHICYNAASYLLGAFIDVGSTPFSFFGILFCSMTATYYGYKMVLAYGKQS